jgi:hypothetical protein
LTKAFDCVNHDILLAKLYYYGIRGMNAKWFETYIANRKQKVQVTPQNHRGDSLCRWETKMLYLRDRFWDHLFIMYVNDLPGGINDFTTPVIYANDTGVLVSHCQKFEVSAVTSKLNLTLNQ